MVNIIGRRVGIQEVGSAAPDNSLGQVFAQLGKTLGADRLTAEYKRQATTKLADENELRKFAVDSIGADGNFSDPRASSIAAALGAIDPAKLGRMRALEGYRLEGLDSQTGQRASAGLGEYNATPEHQRRALDNALALKDREEATKTALAANLPETVMVGGVPTVVPRSQAYGAPAVQSTDQVKAGVQQKLLPTIPQERQQDFAFGAQSPGELGVATTGTGTVPAFVRQNGIFNAQTGAKIEEPVTSVGKLVGTTADALKPASGDQSALLNRRVAARSASSAIDNLDRLLAQPDAAAAVGFIGKSATIFNDIRAQAEAASKLIAPGGLAAEASVPGFKEAVDGAMSKLQANPEFAQRAQALGVRANVLRSQIVDLAYTIAKAKDPSGRMSNQDVDRASEILGGALMDPVAGRQVLGTVRQQIMEQQNIFEQEYERMYPGKGAQPTSPAPAGAPQPGAQPGGVQPGGVQPGGVQPAQPRQMQTRSGATVTIERVQ